MIREFENRTKGRQLAIGDLKAILATIMERDYMITLVTRTAPRLKIYNNRHDGVQFDAY